MHWKVQQRVELHRLNDLEILGSDCLFLHSLTDEMECMVSDLL